MLGETKKSASIRKSAKLPKLSIQQQIDNQEVADRMNRKIGFTKNPRHLLHTMSYAEAFVTTDNSQAKFRVEPQRLSFSDYDVSHVYESELRLINNSKVIQRIKITPLKNKQFLLANIKYPKENSGDIAPGMAVVVTIRFRPNSLNDYEDQLVVIAGDGVIRVPIIAQRQRCSIGWPKKIECGHCWVGDTIKKQVFLKNKGGQATYSILGCNQNEQIVKKGYFKIFPARIKFGKNTQEKITVQFYPEMKGVFKQSIRYKTYEGDQEQIEISLQGGAYSAQIVLQSINNEKMLQRRMNNTLFIQNTQLAKQSTASLKIRNLAVVQVDFFWHYKDENIIIDKKGGKIKPSQLIQFNIKLVPRQIIPETIKIQLYLHNLPEKSLEGGTCTKNINGIQAIPCLNIEVKTKPILSLLQVYPLHRQITQPLYQNSPVKEWVGLINNSSVKRNFKIEKIFQDQDLQTICEQKEGVIQAKSQKKVQLAFNLKNLSVLLKQAYYLVEFDNSESQIFSIDGKSTYPELIYSEDILYYGLCKTFTLNKRQLKIKNVQKTPVQFKIINQHRFYELEFYEFYQFQDQNSYKRRFNIYNPISGLEITQPFIVPPQTQITLDCYLNTMSIDSISLDIFFQVKNGVKSKLQIVAQVQDVQMSMNRTTISMREIYKGNVYNSNKFLSRQLQIINEGNHDCAFEILRPDFDACQLKIQPLKGIIKKKTVQRIDLIIQPIKTGDFDINIVWKFFDDFKMNAKLYLEQGEKTRYNEQDERKTLVKQKTLQLTGTVKGMAVNYYLKDESKAKKIKVKIDDLPQSVKMSNSSFHPSSIRSAKSLHENQKLVYPVLEELNFFNCQINQVKQIQIIIQNDSGLTTQYQIFAEQFSTFQKDSTAQKKSNKGLIKVQEQPFSSQMGKTFIKRRALDRSQKVHLGNNKGISILCEPASGTLYKKQNQKILITMFNDTSGRFKDFLVISVKNHQTKKVPINIHIKGTPVALSKNQLGIDFNQQLPFMNLGMILHSNGLIRKNIKVVNNGPKQVELKWFIYPHNKVDKQKDLFHIQLQDPPQGSEDLVQIKWNALKPQVDQLSYFDIEPKQKIIKGREQINFTIIIQEIKSIGIFSNLLVCQPYLLGDSKKIEMECLAVVLQTETIEAVLSTDIENKNNINKFQKLAIPHEQEQTDSKNNVRVLKFKNNLSTNLTFDLQLFNKDQQFESFKLVAARTNSPATTFSSTKRQVQTSFVITSDSILEVTVELVGNPANSNEWPLQSRIRKEGQLIFSYSNKQQQKIDLVGWLLRPWVQIQMPDGGLCSPQNFEIDFGTVHVKNAKIHSIYLFNPSKTDGKYTISYIKYHQSIKYKFQQSLWTNLDYQDQKIQDEKKCWKLSQDSGLVNNNTIPIHYMPGSLALPDQDDKYAQTHKPIQIQIQFKPEANVLYKSKFRITVKQGPSYDIVMKGKGTYEEELQKK